MHSRHSFVASALACALLSSHDSLVAADYTVKAAASPNENTWQGYGTSLCWWANVFGERADVADALFTLKPSVTLEGATGEIPGLGFNIARYNVGGSSKGVVNVSGTDVAMKMSSKMPDFKFMESFMVGLEKNELSSPIWNWEADSKQRAMMKLAVDRGVDQIEAFSNSPPWWMNKNLATAGGDDGTVDNLKTENHEAFALYLASVVKKARTDWGIEMNYVELFNEPSETWWQFPGGQEGCHFSFEAQQAILPLLRKQLDAMDLQDVAIAAADENSPTRALENLKSLSANPNAVDTVEKWNTHGYEGLKAYRGPDRHGLNEPISQLGMDLWNSELGEEDGTGLTMAETIGLDINEMGVSGIVYWQALDSGGWGLIQSNPGDNWIGEANPKYYVMAQYSRHIRPGMKILVSDDPKTVIGYDSDKEVLVIVTVNMEAAQTITFDLASFAAVGGPIKAWTTETSGKGALYEESTLSLTDKSIAVNFPAASVMTLQVEKVTV
ncbi:hypothetical protein CCR75_002178 [Bremia lactucae]|uniref:Endo-beta-1,6-galactanase-like domain-containing protein n=1 Tax=Bremia lactucae TaxID=4779 RepID=A0A976FSG4_BRELC|nr:hypothetical protein CCR75_002178 [Bremia lactucae]